MKITLEMILSKLCADFTESLNIPKELGERPLLGIRLLPQCTKNCTQDYLYIADASDEWRMANIPRSVPVLFFSSGKPSVRKHEDYNGITNVSIQNNKDGQFLLSAVSAHGLADNFNLFQECYFQFLNWEREFDFALLQNQGMQALIDIANEMIDAPILIFDPTLKLLAYSKGQENLEDRIFQNAIKNGYLDYEAVQYFESVNTFETIHESGEISGNLDEFRQHADIIRAIRIKNDLAVYCVLVYTNMQSRPYTRQLFKVFCDSVYRLLEKQHSTFLRDRSVTDYFLSDLLDNPETPDEQIRERIQYNDLDYNGNFLLITLHSEIRKKSAEQYFILFLRNNLIGCRIFPYQDHIVILYQLPISENAHYRTHVTALFQRLLKNYSAHHPRLSVSRPFTTIGFFYHAWLQAEHTLRLVPASETSKDLRLFFFEDYWLNDFIQQNPYANQDAFYCEPVLLELARQNTKKSRQRLEILYQYLIHDRNISDAAAVLGMHRNNIIYHIKQLQEQYLIDFDDYETRLKLLLSFKIMERHR